MKASFATDRHTHAGYSADVARPSPAAPGLARQLAPFCVFFTGCYSALIMGDPMVVTSPAFRAGTDRRAHRRASVSAAAPHDPSFAVEC